MNFLKRFPPFEILLITVITGIHLYAAFSDAYNFPNSWFTRDDAYYYFKVAQNITEGHGITFDGINLTNGYHPLWMLVCIPVFALARFDLILPLRVMLLIMAGFNAATAILIYRLVKNNLSHAVGMLAASFWAFNFYIHNNVYEFGLETPLAAFAIVLFIYKLSQIEKDWRKQPVTPKQLMTLAGIATLVMFSRLDLVFLAIIGGAWIILRGKPIRFLLPLDIVIIFLSMTTSVALRTGIPVYNSLFAASAVQAAIVALVVKIIALYFLGAYQHPRENSVSKTILQTGLALTISAVILTGLYLLLAQLGIGRDFPRSAFIIDLGLSTFLILTLRLAGYWFGNKQIKSQSDADKKEKSIFTSIPLKEFQANWKTWLTEAISYFGIVGGALSLYMLFNRLIFGTSSPVSGQIKRWWGTLGETVYDSPAPNWTAFFGISNQGAYDAWQPASGLFLWLVKFNFPKYTDIPILDDLFYIFLSIMVLTALIVLFANAQRTRRVFTNMALVPLMAGCGIQILSYTTTAYGGAKEWYWVSQMVFVTLLGSVVLDFMIRPLLRTKVRFAVQYVSVAACLLLAYRFGAQVVKIMPYNFFPPERPYMDVLPYLEENTPPGSIIGMTGGGNVGYFIHDRTIVNMDGLINSNEYFHALQNGEAPAYLRQHGMTIVFASPRLLELPPYFGQFTPYLENFSEYGGKGLLYLLEKPKY
ncbi:hypothetical protein [Candidatus Villigracilis affinis]|uniref:hypothetical protein n=1 Tax=Candidatus Villigracilis affinis TaxID=3140682 RepID=UPI002A1F5635|nr:hypothetical protein [Anaerolineales bacterium]